VTHDSTALVFILVAIPTFRFPGNQSQTKLHSDQMLPPITTNKSARQ